MIDSVVLQCKRCGYAESIETFPQTRDLIVHEGETLKDGDPICPRCEAEGLDSFSRRLLISDDIPSFTLRANDICSVATLKHYASECAGEGSPQRFIDTIQEMAGHFEIWQMANPYLTGFPHSITNITCPHRDPDPLQDANTTNHE
ncbi:MAG TPA: hypothetical protein P5531_10710 [Bacteroidales bacterium]|nr:hypothetical protein [Bacteroidales bacterium]HSA43567.1 hypothetical protein [Bacteroidales bacterium]